MAEGEGSVFLFENRGREGAFEEEARGGGRKGAARMSARGRAKD